ncbi:MAG TPA: DUF4982 domain-containing protein, partial [Gemmataceae bacterium]|nr:DUF4982 domain-containing protein [Gemmataceae bacterium]
YTWHPEEYQDTFHEVYWKQLASRPYLWVKSVWDMFDFAVDSRNEGDTPGRNDKGLVSYDRKTLKDSFYWYKANWSTSPVLYLTSRSYINRPTNLVDLKVYSNLSAVQLSINGVVIGTTTSTDHIFRWSAVQLTPGANAIEVTAKRNGTTFTDDVTWYAPMQLAGVPFARIKFQPIGLPVAAGYLPDYGYIYGDRGNGFTYGWDSDNSANTFARGVMSDPRYDSGIAMEQPTGGHAWQIAVPNGTYAIHLVSGDPSNFDSIDEIAVQGVLAVSGGVNVLSRYQEAWRTVTVANGLLTITNATGSSNDKLDFVEINRTDGGVQVATATHFALTASTSATAGGPIGVTVIALNASGGVAAGYTGTVHFTSSDGQALLPADYTFGNADAGIHTFPNAIILKTAGSGSLTVQDAISNSISGNALVSVAPAAASHFSVRTALSSMAGHAFSGTVAALDPYGNTAISYTGTVHFTSSDGQATLPTDYTFVGGDAGTHTFTNTFILKTAGVQTITASDNLHGSMTGTAMLGVSAAAAALYTVTAPASSAAGNALGITVRAVDAFGNTAANYTGTVHFSSSDIQAVLPADYTFMKSDAGMHSFGNAVTFKTSGGQSLTVLDTATVSISGSIQNIAVSAAPASHLLASVSGSTTAGTPFDLTVKAVDSYGNLDTRYQGTVQFTTSDATGGQLPANYTFTSSDTGIHTFAAAAALFTAGSQTVTAADAASGIAGSTTVALAPAPANHFALTVLAEVAAKVPFDATVTALDPYGNTDINYQGTVHFMTSDTDPGVVLPADYAFAASDRGVHLFGGGIVLMTAGKQTVTATDMTNGALLQSVSITVDPGTMPPPPGMAGGREGLSSTPVLDPAMVIGSTPASQQATPTDRLFASPENWGSGRQTGVSALWLERGQRVPHSLADSSSLVVEEQGEDLIHSALIGRDSSGPARFV